MRRLLRAIVALVASIFVTVVCSTDGAVAQPRPLDVPYVPTPVNVVDAMLRLAKPGPDDVLIDLGCGDGRIPVAAARQFGTRGLGIDLNPLRIAEAKVNAEKAGVADKVEFLVGDLFEFDFSRATVLTLYLLPEVNMELRKQILIMKPGTRVVSHAYDFGDWLPDASEKVGVRRVYYWVVPARVAGWWTGSIDGNDVEIEVRQAFQKLSGVSRAGQHRAPIAEGRVAGQMLTFEIDLGQGRRKIVSARVEGTSITGEGVSLKRI